MNINISSYTGRIARNPILKPYKNAKGEPGNRCFFTLAVTRLADLGKKKAEQRTSWIPVVVWGKLAERCAQYLEVGTEVSVTGEMVFESNPVMDAAGNHVEIDGVKQYKSFNHCNSNNVQFGRKSSKNQAAGGNVDQAAAISALEARIDALANGDSPAAGAPAASTNTATTVTEGNPFESDAVSEADVVAEGLPGATAD